MSDAAIRTFERARQAGDICAHNALKAYRQRAGLPPEVPEELTGYDWDEAFGVAGDELGTGGNFRAKETPNFAFKYNSADIRPAKETKVSLAPFDRRDIKKLIAYADGKNDGPEWIALMELWDGRFAYLEAGCDYTGWDCQSGGSVSVANCLEDLDIQSNEKERFTWL